jgi:hypothetical protein
VVDFVGKFFVASAEGFAGIFCFWNFDDAKKFEEEL